MPEILALKGMVNTVDPVRTELGDLESGLNIDLDDTGSAIVREGQTAFGSFGAISSAFATRDMQHLYVVDAGDLKSVRPDGTSVTLKSGLPSGEIWWTEAGNYVIYSGAAQGMILGDQWRSWGIDTPTPPKLTAQPGSLPAGRYLVSVVLVDSYGRQGGADHSSLIEFETPSAIQMEATVPAGHTADFYISSTDGEELYFCGNSADGLFLYDGDITHLTYPLSMEQDVAYPPPSGEQVAYFAGRTYLAQAHPTADVTHIFYSQPLASHLFDYTADFITVPGEVRLLCATSSGLVIGTDREIYVFDGEALVKMAEYGVVEGHASSPLEDGNILFWTERGLCRALPFENLTEARFSFVPGDRAVVQFMQHNGYSKALVVVRNGGEAFNKYEAG